MDIAVVAMNEFRKWMVEHCEKKEDGLFSFHEYLFELNENPDSQDKPSLKILKASEDESEKYIVVAQIMEFLKEDELRIEQGQKEVLDEIRSIIEADNIAKELIQNIKGSSKEQQAMTLKIRQYG